MNYTEATESLKENKKAKRPSLGGYIFASPTNEGALCKKTNFGVIEYLWQPTEEDLKAEDWEAVEEK